MRAETYLIKKAMSPGLSPKAARGIRTFAGGVAGVPIGAALGGATGALSGMIDPGEDEQHQQKSRLAAVLKNMLMGTGIGAIAGGGIGTLAGRYTGNIPGEK